MSGDDKVALIGQLSDGLFDCNGQTYTYYPLGKFLSKGYLYVSSLWTKMTENCYLLSLSCRCCYEIAQRHQNDRVPKHNKYHAHLFHSTN